LHKLFTILPILLISSSALAGSFHSQCEKVVLDNYKNEFLERALRDRNRKIDTVRNAKGKKVKKITYDQIQTSKTTSDNVKELVLVADRKRVVDYNFEYGSIDFEEPDKGQALFKLVSKNVLNKSCETKRLTNSYKVKVTNTYDKEVNDVDLSAGLDISTDVCHDIASIEARYEKRVTEQSIAELAENDNIHLTSNANGYEETNEKMLKMVLKERQGAINEVLKEYDSSFTIEVPKFVSNPSQVWDEFYIKPIQFIKTICDNSHNLAKRTSKKMSAEALQYPGSTRE